MGVGGWLRRGPCLGLLSSHGLGLGESKGQSEHKAEVLSSLVDLLIHGPHLHTQIRAVGSVDWQLCPCSCRHSEAWGGGSPTALGHSTHTAEGSLHEKRGY